MKLKVGSKVYLQRIEIGFMTKQLSDLPSYIIKGLMNAKRRADTDFVICFEDEESISWLLDQDWILDYEEYVGYNLRELDLILHHLNAEYATKTKRYFKEDETARQACQNEFKEWAKKHNHKIDSLEQIILAKRTHKEIRLPDGYEPKKSQKRSERIKGLLKKAPV